MADREGTGFALFGETVITGVITTLLAAPLVTLLPALAAGISHLRRYLAGESVRISDVLRDFSAACRSLWRSALLLTALGLLLTWNLTLAETGLPPGSAGVLAGSAVLLTLWAVLLLRTAAAWRVGAGDDDPAPVRRAARRLRADPGGSALLALALTLCGVFVWMLLPMLLLAPGLAALAVVAVEHQRPPPVSAPDARPPAGCP